MWTLQCFNAARAAARPEAPYLSLLSWPSQVSGMLSHEDHMSPNTLIYYPPCFRLGHLRYQARRETDG